MFKWKVYIQADNTDDLKTVYLNAESIQHLLTTIDSFGIDSRDIIKIERQ